jgi:hypothetical protein
MVRAVVLLFALVAAGCVAREVLLPKSATVPVGVDFSGNWELRGDPVALPRGRESDGELVRVFLETGQALGITQTEHGIFISFDRAVVEEYRFGEQRQVNVGPIVADRVSGWEGPGYVVETLDDDGVKLVDSYRLADGDRSLRRDIVILRGGKRTFESSQLFDRR